MLMFGRFLLLFCLSAASRKAVNHQTTNFILFYVSFLVLQYDSHSAMRSSSFRLKRSSKNAVNSTGFYNSTKCTRTSLFEELSQSRTVFYFFCPVPFSVVLKGLSL